ncbi:hypothetical protein P9112_009698 [Eukaryota sp. TZLM1-RC]
MGYPTILVFLGSFNPPTKLHIAMMEEGVSCAEKHGYSVQQVIVSPVSNHYGKPGLLPIIHRLNMLNKAIGLSPIRSLICIDEWESNQKNYVRSYTVLKRIQDQYSNHKVLMLSGADLVEQMSCSSPVLWPIETLEPLLSEFKVIVIQRGVTDLDSVIETTRLCRFRDSFIPCNKLEERPISSTATRELIARGESDNEVLTYISQPVLDYIKQNKLYL